MALTADQCQAQVIVPGGAVVVANTYYGDGATTFVKGDLVRITTSGQIKDAATDNTSAGSCHGMILETWATAPTTSQFVKILKFAVDTVLKVQVYNGTAANAEPQDVTVGVSYTLRNNAAGKWCITTTTTNGNALIVGKAGDSKWFETDEAIDADYGFVYVRFIQSILDGHAS